MITREQIREKLLNIPHNSSIEFCGVMVEYSHQSYHIMHKDSITDNLTLKEAIRTVFNTQTAPSTTQPPNPTPTKR